jgi:hypothetical protein
MVFYLKIRLKKSFNSLLKFIFLKDTSPILEFVFALLIFFASTLSIAGANGLNRTYKHSFSITKHLLIDLKTQSQNHVKKSL